MRRLALLLILCGCDTEPEPKTESAQKPATNSPTIAQSTPEWQAELYALQRELANGNADRKKALDFIASRQFGTLEEALTAAGPDVMPGTVGRNGYYAPATWWELRVKDPDVTVLAWVNHRGEWISGRSDTKKESTTDLNDLPIAEWLTQTADGKIPAIE